MTTIRTNSLLTKPDVLIVGGGAAGVAAAAGAAQAGARVTLLEKNGFLGGKATAAYVGTVCGLWYRDEHGGPRWAHRGFPKIFGEELQKRCGTQPVSNDKGLHFLPYDQFDFMRLCDEYALQYTESLCLHAHVTLAAAEAGMVSVVEAFVDNRFVIFYPQTVIDTSGDAVLARSLPAPSLKSDEYQASAQVFRLAGLPPADARQLSLSLLRAIRQGLASGTYPTAYERVSVVPGSVFDGQALFKLGIPLRIGNDPLSATETALFARQAIPEILDFLRKHADLFQNAWLSMIAPETGIRTGPRHLGGYVLSLDDLLKCRKHTDAVARGVWPIEHWAPGQNPAMTYLTAGDHYDIPARVLQSERLPNLYFAGRNLSATDEAIASARVIGTCLATGFAAGRLAAGAALQEPRGNTIAAIREHLF